MKHHRAQVFAGNAKVYVYNNKPFRRTKSYRTAQRQAKYADRGLWGHCWTTARGAGSRPAVDSRHTNRRGTVVRSVDASRRQGLNVLSGLVTVPWGVVRVTE